MGLSEIITNNPSQPSLGKGRGKVGFTLAEVLITLGIIGVVAAMTIPSLVQEYKVKRTVTILKSSYSILSQALESAIQDNGEVNNWTRHTSSNTSDEATDIAKNFFGKIRPYIKNLKECTANEDKIYCWSGEDYSFYLLNGNKGQPTNYAVSAVPFVLGNGIKAVLVIYSSELYPTASNIKSVPAGLFRIKTDNAKKNVFGKNIFDLYIYNDRLLPAGHATTSYMTFKNQCAQGTTSSGQGCAAWVIFNENMDYLKCNDLSWSGKHSCKD